MKKKTTKQIIDEARAKGGQIEEHSPFAGIDRTVHLRRYALPVINIPLHVYDRTSQAIKEVSQDLEEYKRELKGDIK